VSGWELFRVRRPGGVGAWFWVWSVVGTSSALVVAGDWPGFRGPQGDGIAPGETPPLKWNAEDGVQWNTPLPAPGNGSAIVFEGRVYLVQGEAKGRKRSLFCFDRQDGELRWARTVSFNRVMPTHRTNPHGSSTPAAGSGRIVVWHGSAGLFCYDVEGREQWRRKLGEIRHMWGYGSSPVIHRDRVVLHAGPGRRVFVAAFDLKTGETLWKQEEPVEGTGQRNAEKRYMGSWSTPVIVEVEGRTIVLCSLATRVVGYDAATGEIAWFCEGLRGRKGDLAYTSPIPAGDNCVAMGGFGGPAIGFRMGGAGNITKERLLWRKEPNPQRIGSGIYVDGLVFQANAGPATFQCLEPETGEIRWQERIPGAACWGSTVFAGGNLYVTDQSGTTHVWKPNPRKLELVASNPLGEPCNATPAVSDGQLFIRTFENLWCIGTRNPEG